MAYAPLTMPRKTKPYVFSETTRTLAAQAQTSILQMEDRIWEKKVVPRVVWGIPISEEGKAKIDAICAKHGVKHLNVTSIQRTDLNATVDYLGNVKVTTAVFEKCAEREILAVLGHEIGHIVKEHVNEKKPEMTEYGQNMSVESMVVIALLVHKVASTEGWNEKLRTVTKFLKFLFSDLKKANEYEADRFAVENGLGDGLASFFRKCMSEERPGEIMWRLFLGWFSDHPADRKRIARIESLMSCLRDSE